MNRRARPSDRDSSADRSGAGLASTTEVQPDVVLAGLVDSVTARSERVVGTVEPSLRRAKVLS
ncbi:MAG TPA: hypothetical protein VNT52_11400, partial [Acidimicrobiales bacterium]|nr:hypothetical protein [Acidimicrobiales bacterium]